MDVAKILRGLFIKDGATGYNKQVEAKVAPVVVAGIRSTAGGNEPTAISTAQDILRNNLLLVGNGDVSMNNSIRTPFSLCDDWTTAAGAASRQIYTVPTGKILYLTAYFHSGPNAAAEGIVIRDAIADGGTMKTGTVVPSNGSAGWSSPFPMEFTNGMRADAADLNNSAHYRMTFVGWLEDA